LFRFGLRKVLLLCFFWTASTQRLGYDIGRPMHAGGNKESARATIQAGNVGDTVLRETGEINCLAVSYG
jgi:hypothetical protein